MHDFLTIVAAIGALGLGAQWLAWRFNLPAIVLMAVAGLIAGPVTGLLWPDDYAPGGPGPMELVFGDLFRPMIALAVAVILFEGGITLNIAEIRGLSRGVFRFVLPGVPIAWFLGSLAAFHIAGLSWGSAILFAGIMIVTGPTVIMPLLRQARLEPRTAALLKWEGIVNDPIGALIAVFVAQAIALEAETPALALILSAVAAFIGAAALGVLLGRLVSAAFQRGLVPEFLKPAILLSLVLVCFVLGDLIQKEAGLLAVTTMGVTIANARLASINELRLFKENIAVLFVSGVFVILTANLTPEDLKLLDVRAFVFVGVMLFLVRPAAVFVSTIGAGLSMKERALLGWIAPRGVVAVAVSTFFAAELVAMGDPTAERIGPLAFLMVFATVVLHGFTIGPLARALGLASKDMPGVLISGASAWSVALAGRLKEMGAPVLIADPSWRRLQAARLANIPIFYGELLSEVSERHIDFNRYGTLLALSDNEAHNALVCTDFAPEFGRASIFQANTETRDEKDRQAVAHTLRGRTFPASGAPLHALDQLLYEGWTFQRTRLTAEYTSERYLAELGSDSMLIAVLRKGALVLQGAGSVAKLETGDVALAFLSAEQAAARRSREKAAGNAPAPQPEKANYSGLEPSG